MSSVKMHNPIFSRSKNAYFELMHKAKTQETMIIMIIT